MLKFPLLDKLPCEFDGIVYDFWWDHDKLHALDLPEKTIPTEELAWLLDLHWWQYHGEPFKITPRQVLEEPTKYHEQYHRTLKADLAYPIIIREDKERKIIIDGVHRLLKAVINNLPTIKVATFNEKMIPLILHKVE